MTLTWFSSKCARCEALESDNAYWRKQNAELRAELTRVVHRPIEPSAIKAALDVANEELAYIKTSMQGIRDGAVRDCIRRLEALLPTDAQAPRKNGTIPP